MFKLKKEFFVFLLILCVITMGGTAILISAASAPGSVTGFYRMFIPTVLFLPVFIFNRIKAGKTHSKEKKTLPFRETLFAVLGGLCFGIDMVCWTTGIQFSGAALPTLLANTSVIWVAIAGLLIFKEKLKALFWVGLGLAGSGVILIFLTSLNFGENKTAGYILGLTAGLFYGLFFILTQSGRKKIGTVDFFWISCAASTLVLFIYNMLAGNMLIGYPLSDILIFITMGLVSQSIVWMALNFLQGHLPGTMITPALLGQPVIAAIFGWIILGQSLKDIQIVGGIIVLAGIIVIYRARRGKIKKAENPNKPRSENKSRTRQR